MKYLATLGVFLSAGAVLGCTNDTQTSQPGTERTDTSAQQLGSSAGHWQHDCSPAPLPDPPPDPPASDCGATDATPCRVASAFTFSTFTDLQSAINASSDGDILTVTGRCGSGSVVNRTNLTIQGNFPSGGCGFNGPSATQLGGEVQGLTVVNSINFSARFLNLVNSTGDGLAIVNSTTPLVSCNCAAFNANDGVRLTGTIAAVVSQTLSEANTIGIESDDTETVVIGNNTVTANNNIGILVANATNNNVSFNIVTNNGGRGILLAATTQSLVTGNTIRGNGDGLVDLITCVDNSQAFGSNVPASCSGF
jgi:parallel beta-helix repeat protein